MSARTESTTLRSAPSHHVAPAELLDHVVGAADDAVSLAVACHLAFCAPCRDDARRLRAMGGALLEAERPQPVGDDVLQRVLGRLDPGPAPGPHRAARASAAGPAAPLAELTKVDLPPAVGRRLAAIGRPRWRYVAPGVRGVDLPVRATTSTAQLLCLRPGLAIPRHDHGALEVTVVITGALLDGGERFGSGDVLFREPGQQHVQDVEPSQDCIALVVNAGRLVPLTWKGRLLKLIARP
jgi:putative transcriptional regulator